MIKRSFTLPPLARRVAILVSVSVGAAIAVSACGGIRREQRAEWRAQAELACIKSGKVRQTPYVKISTSINGPGVCGANYPMKVSALTSVVPGKVAGTGNLMLTSGNLMLTSITPTATLSCPMVTGVDTWLGGEVQRAAMTWFGQPVIELITFGSFSCRPMNNRAGSRLSEHSFANAIDAKAFRLADGRVVTVLKGWRGPADEQGFLREVAIGACTHFSTVLAPGSDAYHYDHLHMDMARHNRGRHVCRPAIQMPQQPSVIPPPLLAQGGYGSQQAQAGFLAQQAPQGGFAAQRPPGSLVQQPPMFVKPSPQFQPQPQRQQARSAHPDFYHGPDDGPEEVEDLQGERNFDGKQFDLTGSIRGKDDPPVVTQRPGPARRP